MSRYVIVEGNSNDKDNVRVIMVKGEKGYSAYDLYKQHGGTHTEEQWLDEFLNAENYYNKNEINASQLVQNQIINKKPYYFNTVSDMKAYNLIDGDMVITEGYHQKNDGGSAIYYITNNSNIEKYKEVLNNGLFAVLITNRPTPEMFGAYGDNNHDDTTAFSNLINYFSEMYLSNKKYIITSLTINKNFIIYGNDATLKSSVAVDALLQMTSSVYNKKLKIYNLNLDASFANVGIYINKNTLIAQYLNVSYAINKNIEIVKTDGYGYCELFETSSNLSAIGIEINASDCKLTNYHGYNCNTHIKNKKGLTHLNNIHCWNYNTNSIDWITGSILIDTIGSIVGSDIYIDTLENGIKLPNDYPYLSIILQNVSYFINTSSYPSTQQSPTLLKNHSNFNGYCRIDGLFCDENNWKDSNNNYPTLIDDINLAKINITNIGNSGFRFNKYKPIETYEDIDPSSYTINVDTYVSYTTRKVKYKDYNIHAYLYASMKTSCPNNTILSQLTFTGQNLDLLNSRTRVQAKFVSTSNPGVVYDLPAHIISSEHKLTIYNNTGIDLGSYNNYGNIYVYIDDIKQT